MADRYGVAVLGCGGIARAHLNAIREIEGLEPVQVVDVVPERAEEVAREYGAPRHGTDWREVLGQDDVDVVDICLPHSMHWEPAVAAARAGKHVFTEKPMAISLAEADAMIGAAEEAGVKLMVGQVLRFRQANVEARRLLREGAIGRPVNAIRRRLSASERRPTQTWCNDPAVAGGWTLYGFGAHEMDMLLWLMDAEAKTVWAQGRMADPFWNDYDNISVLLNLDNDCFAALHHSLNAHVGAWDQLIVGTEGSIYITTDAIRLNGKALEGDFDYRDSMRRQWEEFLRALMEDHEPEASGRSVRRTMVALEAAKMSLATGDLVEAAKL